MLNLSASQRAGVLLALLAMIASTRMSHFGTAHLLPDASLAMFLLGGLIVRHGLGFVVLIFVAFGLDIYAAQSAAEAAWCFTPAYAGLIPTYGLLWLTGVALGPQQRYARPMIALPVSLIAVSLAFIFSNGWFFAFHGVATPISLNEFGLAVAPYFPAYLGSAMLYLAPAFIAAALWRKSRLAAW